jgi:cytochrome c oxidase assembly protein subunit 11
MQDKRDRDAKLALNLLCIVAGMTMLAYASVPLYRIFCQVTGFGGTTMKADSLPDKIYDHVITVRFNTDNAEDLQWKFKPLQNQVKVRVGEGSLAFFEVLNYGKEDIAGVATYNVTPLEAGKYFHKMKCFCYEEQVLKSGQTMDFPVSFFIDPAILKDEFMRSISTITLSYTFFKAQDQNL